MNTEPGTELAVRDMDLIAKRVAESRLFGLDQAQAFTLMLLAQAEGLPYISAVRRFHIIDGKPSMRADAMQAEFQRHGGIVRWVVTTDQEVKAEFSHPLHQPEPVTVCVTLKEMTDKGITTGKFGVKDNWKKFPRQMLRARAISEGVRMVDPGIVCGIYTPEEVGDFTKPIEVEARPIPEHHAINHDNGTGHGVGAYPKPEVVEAYQSFLNAVVSEINQKWLDRITDKQTGEMLSADGEIVDTGKLSRYLLDWAKGMDWVKAPLEVRVGQRDKFAAVAWEQHMDEFMEETRRYFKTLWNQSLKKIKPVKPPTKRDNEVEEVAAENAAMDALLTSEAGARG